MTGPRHVRGEHTCDRHQPGARACYSNHGCRCRDCTDTATAVARKYKWVHGNGRSAKVPGGPVRAHLSRLRAAGMSTAEIERVTGVPQATFRNVESGRVTDVQRPTAQAILEARPVPVAQQRAGFVDGTGTRRRLQALCAIGWTGADLGPRISVTRKRLRDIIRSGGDLSADLRARVMALYDDLWDQPRTGTPATRAIAAARRSGWPPPLAWDDDHGPHGIDNPDATPSIGSHTRARGSTVEDIEYLVDADETAETISARLGVRWENLADTLRRNGRQDLLDRLNRRRAA